jgi:hypothetical protein
VIVYGNWKKEEPQAQNFRIPEEKRMVVKDTEERVREQTGAGP